MFSVTFGMVVILIILFMLIIYSTSCKKYEYEEDEVYSKGDSVFTMAGEPLTGTIVDFYLVTGEKYTEENYVNGVRNGKSIVYYKNGNVQREVSYENGLRDGFHITYFEEGPRARIKSFKKGIAHGIEDHYYLGGGTWRRMDFEDGMRVFYHNRYKYNKIPISLIK
jgi:antitoxin component YwqK of YwqJK toxin-antitoxin module